MRPAATISSLALDDNDDGSALVLAAAVAFLQNANGTSARPIWHIRVDVTRHCICARTADENLWLKRRQQGLLRAEGLPSSVHGKRWKKNTAGIEQEGSKPRQNHVYCLAMKDMGMAKKALQHTTLQFKDVQVDILDG